MTLTPISAIDRSDKKHPKMLFRCSCGDERFYSIYDVCRKKNKCCRSCSKRGANNPQWSGYKDINGEYWSRVIYGAKIRKIPVEITIEDAWQQFVLQNKRCALTGVELAVSNPTKVNGNASLDRIDNTKGYVAGNIQWVHKAINLMKLDMVQEDFINWCKKVVENNL